MRTTERLSRACSAASSRDSALPSVNYHCEIAFSRKVGGIYSAFVNTLAAMSRTGQFRCRSNAVISRGILHAHTSGPMYWVVRALHRGKVVVHAHVIPETFVGQVRGASLCMRLLRRYMTAFFNSADAVICMTDTLKKQLLAMGVRSPVVVLRYPLDLSIFRRSPELRRLGRERLGLKPTDRVVLSAGMMIPRKGIFEFAEVARINADIQFVWVGDIPHAGFTASHAEIKRLVRTAPRNLHFPGAVGLAEMPAVYNTANLFFFPSRQETFGLAIAEAAACGLPLLLRDLDTYREAFPFVYLAGEDVAHFSQTIREVIFSEPELRKWGGRARTAIQAHDSEQVARNLANLYHDLLGGQAVPTARG
jgi:1,2-diacylglycerol-3-alpha-glucose alpha-1,2-galactosyltransferase